jgi:acetylornithine deacetylase/succinyl-diaminopimelate desuccinylase-like protein
VVFGAGDLTRAHSNDERLSVAELERGLRVLSLFLAGGVDDEDNGRFA